MLNSRVHITLFTLLSLLPAIVLALLPTMSKYFKIAHGPIEGSHNAVFLLAFFVTFWGLFLSVALLRSNKLKSRLTIKRVVKDILLDGLTGAAFGYLAALFAYLVMILLSVYGPNLGRLWTDRYAMLYVFPALLMGNYCWLLGSMCFVIFDVLTRPLRSE